MEPTIWRTSLMLGGVTAGLHLNRRCANRFEPDPQVVADSRRRGDETGASVTVTNDPGRGAANADVLVTDTWTSMGQEDDGLDRIGPFRPFQINDELVALAGPRRCWSCTVFPRIAATRSPTRSSTARTVSFWDEAENRLHAQKALLIWLLEQP